MDELSDSPVRIEIYFSPDKYKIDPKRCIEYEFFFEGSENAESMYAVDRKILETLFRCTFNVGKVVQKYIDSHDKYKRKVIKEIDELA